MKEWFTEQYFKHQNASKQGFLKITYIILAVLKLSMSLSPVGVFTFSNWSFRSTTATFHPESQISNTLIHQPVFIFSFILIRPTIDFSTLFLKKFLLLFHICAWANIYIYIYIKSVALQLRRAKTDRSGCCQMTIQGALWLAKRLSLNLNFSFLNRIRYFSYQVATQLSSRGWVDPVPDLILPEKFLGYSRESNPGPLGWQSDIYIYIYIYMGWGISHGNYFISWIYVNG